MKRNTTVLVICGLLFVADLIWLRLILDGRESLAALRASIAFAGQALGAATFLAVAYLLLRKRYARQKKPARGLESHGALQPLRRLFAAVLS
jgi:hypothetical protein